jgi:hypothetical protein
MKINIVRLKEIVQEEVVKYVKDLLKEGEQKKDFDKKEEK